MNAFESKGHDIYYCDTDSVISNCDIHKYPDLMEKFKWDGSGKELGSLKDESEELVEKHFTKKIRKQHKYKDTEKTLPEHKQEIREMCGTQTNRWFDSAVIGGLKFYSLQKVLHNGDKAEINKLKGGSAAKLCHQDYLEKTCMEQTCTQFKCGIRGYMDEENPFAIRVGPIDKKFNYAYSKGVVQEGTVMLKPICV